MITIDMYQIGQVIYDAALIIVGIGITLIVRGISEFLDERNNAENQFRRAAHNWKRRSRKSMEKFKSDIQRVTRR